MFVQGCGQYSEFSAKQSTLDNIVRYSYKLFYLNNTINVFDELYFDSASSPLKNSKYRLMIKSGLLNYVYKNIDRIFSIV